jgi:hypothetical protein
MPQILGMISVQVAGDAILYLENTFGKRNIFIDIDRLRAGLKFKTVLEDKLGQCKMMLSIIGPNWIDARDRKTGSRRSTIPRIGCGLRLNGPWRKIFL